MATRKRFEGTPAQQRAKLERAARQERSKKAQLKRAFEDAAPQQKLAALLRYVDSLEQRIAALEETS